MMATYIHTYIHKQTDTAVSLLLHCKYVHNSAAPCNDNLPAGCGYKYMKRDAMGHSQQPTNNQP